ncbi:MAG: M4 family metallopeptidase [Vicinamibacterales bacterium]
MRVSFGGLTCVTSLVVGVFLLAVPSAQTDRAVDVSRGHFDANRRAYGVANPTSELKVRGSRSNGRGQSHVRYDQFYRGLPVFEGEAIAHVEANDSVTVTSNLRGNISLNTAPRVTRNQAVATSVRTTSPLGDYVVTDASLVILPRGERSIVDRLTWHVVITIENDFQDPAEWHHFVDARTGDVVYSFDGLETSDAAGTAKTMYSGTQAIRVDKASASKYNLRDLTQGGGNYTCDMRNGTSSCTLISGSTSTFGIGSITTTGATAGADAHFGLQATLAYYKQMFGRVGIDGKNRKTYSRVHYSRSYENAFWSNSCFCMTYGDGATTFQPLVSIDVAGHEMSHGVMSTEANLTYSGESGGLNESNSDIFGTLVEAAVNAATDVPDYWIGERIYKSNWSGTTFTQTKALRYMDDPAKDGASPACWYSGIGNLNVHYSSGPNNHMFYLLAEGGTSKCNGQVVTGIGKDKAARIWYKAIADYMTASTNYAGARAAAISAATALNGQSGIGAADLAAVKAAFSAINVN